jgi:hypothetical protein
MCNNVGRSRDVFTSSKILTVDNIQFEFIAFIKI